MFEDYRFFTFGDLMRSFRERQGITIQELEATMGRHRNTLSAWENGKTRPRLRDDVLQLAEELHLSQFETDLLLYKAEFPLEYHRMPLTLSRSAGQPYGYLHVRNTRPEPLSFVLCRERHQLGRHQERCDLVVPAEYLKVSRVHAAVTWVHDQVYVEDCASANGTFVDAMRVVKPTRLEEGQHITLGGRSAGLGVCVLEYSLEPVETRRD